MDSLSTFVEQKQIPPAGKEPKTKRYNKYVDLT